MRQLHYSSQAARMDGCRAVQLDGQNPYSHYAVAITHIFAGKLERARRAAEQAVSLSPSFALSHLVLGACMLLLGQSREAIRELEQGLHLNPFDPHGAYWRFHLALAHYVGAEPTRGLEQARVCLEMRPHWSVALRVAIACLVTMGDHAGARQSVTELDKEGDAGQDLLVSVTLQQPEWVQRIDACVAAARARCLKP
jgi:adenylate cyclase